MDQMIDLLSTYFIPALIGVCVIVAIVFRTITSIYMHASTERSRREIAAYIAEGSITPEQGERLLKADVGRRSCGA